MFFLRYVFYWLVLVSTLYGLASCRVMAPQPMIDADFYQIIHADQPVLKNQKVYVTDLGDSLQVIIPAKDERRYVAKSTYKSWTFKRSEADIDVFTLPFKIRTAQGNLPAQLNSNFNAALYIGRRVDLYNYRWKTVTPTFAVRELRSRGFGYGVFAGLGAVAMNDFVVRRPLGIEYEGVVVDAGVAAIYDARIFNVGFAVGMDYLTDQNRTQWIYQQKPWFGVLFGLNLN